MFSEFLVYARLGFTHIADLQGYDHILFLVALTAGYATSHWRSLLWLVTAFTVLASLEIAGRTRGGGADRLAGPRGGGRSWLTRRRP